MQEFAIILAQAGAVAMLAGWLTTGVYDNIRHPEVNEPITVQVMEMTLMQRDYPDIYAQVAYRIVTSRGLQKLAFCLVVLAELIATAMLWVGAGALLLSLGGIVPVSAAQALGLLGALTFTAIWADFLLAGNCFCYWLCHFVAQNTHYQMTLWGVATMILLVAA